MSVCRLSNDCNLYIYEHVNGKGYACDGCDIAGENGGAWLWQDGYDNEKMLAHLDQHAQRGHKVPDYVFEFFRERVA